MILVISKPRTKAEDLSDMLNFMGVISTAKTPPEAAAEASTAYRAIILIGGTVLYDEYDFVRKLRSIQGAPIYSLGKPISEENFDLIIDESCSAAKILSKIRDFSISNNLSAPGEYKLYGIDASINKKAPSFFSRSFHLTKTELMILRALIRFYPNPIKARELLYYAFRRKRAPEEAGIRTHISSINKKFEAAFSRRIIINPDGEGYLILTNEISEKLLLGAT